MGGALGGLLGLLSGRSSHQRPTQPLLPGRPPPRGHLPASRPKKKGPGRREGRPHVGRWAGAQGRPWLLTEPQLQRRRRPRGPLGRLGPRRGPGPCRHRRRRCRHGPSPTSEPAAALALQPPASGGFLGCRRGRSARHVTGRGLRPRPPTRPRLCAGPGRGALPRSLAAETSAAGRSGSSVHPKLIEPTSQGLRPLVLQKEACQIRVRTPRSI